MSDIFISYASPDRAVAQRLASALAGEGWSVWWDRTILPGKSFARTIEDALNDTLCVVVLWSTLSRESDWVQNEARHGHERHALIPVLIEDVNPPFEFQHIHAASLIGWDGEASHPGYRQLVAAISDLAGALPKREETGGQAANKAPAQDDLPDLSVFREVDELWCPEMVALPAGEFMMGSPDTDEDADDNEKPRHKVVITARFAIGRYPVTFEEYDRFCDATGRDKPKDHANYYGKVGNTTEGGRIGRIRRVCATCTGMFGSGWRMSGMILTGARPMMVAPGEKVATALAVWCPAVPGSTVPASSDRPIAVGAIPASG